MRILYAGLLLLLLSADGLANETPYDKFKRQHVDATMTKDNCDTQISRKKIYKNGVECKPINTFILSQEETVKSICNGVGRVVDQNEGKTESNIQFRVVVCTLNSGKIEPNCKYDGEDLTGRRVVVKCKNKLPVHYYGDTAS